MWYYTHGCIQVNYDDRFHFIYSVPQALIKKFASIYKAFPTKGGGGLVESERR